MIDNKIIEMKMMNACLKWFGEENNTDFTKNIKIIHKEDEDNYHRRIYFMSYTEEYTNYYGEKVKCTNVYIIRVWGTDADINNDCISLSQDYYSSADSAEDMALLIPDIIQKVLEVK